MAPSGDEVGRYTDKYFARTRTVVERFGDCRVTYAVFMRRPVLSTPRLALDWLRRVVAERKAAVEVELLQQEGDWVGAGEPLMYLHGPFRHLVDLETVFLQRLGPACVAAYNAYTMCTDLPYAGFLAMDTRHCAGAEMAELMAYAASVGSARAQRETGAKGFIGNSTDATAHFFGQPSGLGTMPHALIGYAGSTLRAAEMFHATFPDDALTVLVDFFGREVTRFAGGLPPLSRARSRRPARASGSTPMAAGSWKSSTSPPPTRCSSAMSRTRSAPTAPRRSWAGSPAPE